jgi:cytochrome P450
LIDSIENIIKYSKQFNYEPWEQYGVFGRRNVVVSDPVLAKEVAALRPKYLRRGRRLQKATDDGVAISLKNGLFHSDGSQWMRIRKLTAPAFGAKPLLQGHPIVYEECSKFVSRITKLVERGDNVVDMKLEAQQFTIRAISRIALGGENADSQYFFSNEFANDIQVIFKFMIEYIINPFPRFVWMRSKKFQIEVDAVAAERRFTEAAKKVVQAAREKRQSEEVRGGFETMLDVLLRKNEDGVGRKASGSSSTVPVSDIESSITDEELVDNVKTFYAAGSETTSIGICWTLYFLAQDRKCVEEIRREVDGYFTNKEAMHNVTDATKTFAYTYACFKEALRLRPPASAIRNELVSLTESIELSNGIILQPGDAVTVSIDALASNETVFSSPHLFNPSRWQSNDPDKLATMEASYHIFGGGRRICPGIGLANLEGTLAVAYLVHSFDFELDCPPSEVVRQLNFTVMPNKLPLAFSMRK